MKNLRLLIILIVIVISFFVIKSFSNKQSCQTLVILTSGEKINCKWVNSYNSGFSNIHKCDNSDFQIETHNIKKIINK